MTALECKSLRSGYGRMEIISGIDLVLSPGDIYALIGKNGAGKSTLVKTLMGILPTLAGSTCVFGDFTTKMGPSQRVGLGMSCAPQDLAFFNDLTVEENLRLGSLSLHRQAYREGRKRVIEMFPFINSRLQQKAGTLSGGEQAMVKVARALLPKPRLVLLDEVTEGLQPMIVEHMRDVLLEDHAQRHTTFLIVEQNMDFVAGLASRFGLIARGAIEGEGHFEDNDARERIVHHLQV